MNVETWIHNEIMDGLSKLLCLGLDRVPAADLIEGTAATWGQALTLGKQWDRELDAPRFRHAFIALAARQKTWPAPADFVEHLPPRRQLVLTKQHIPADPERTAVAVDEIAKMLRPCRTRTRVRGRQVRGAHDEDENWEIKR
ncbi:hypothetical protein MNO14_04990 [Luteimonas sp. S4-F44]|uniref:hypothetical protein n=1 Tax=Luteimonas sp. S4-F44 TaxID=2925842 RepID=UPI001F52D0BE|nr:hypothetical protein [Luteimonas sp. S4-F44]UNK43442.1 hypothetical protein MNO14_04990 [Luteimonas sp. S4-F44]